MFHPCNRSVLLLACIASSTTVGIAETDGIAFFESKIRPVLVEHCYACHSASSKGVKGGLLLDFREGMLDGGDSGPAIVPGKPEESLILSAMRHENFEMPPTGRLSDKVLADFETWIRIGAPDPRLGEAVPKREGIDIDEGRKFWAFQKIRDGRPPTVKDARWPTSDIDRFILAGLEAKGLHPSRPADRRTLIRRITFDLIGLPPTPEEIVAFEKDSSPDAFERLVDRLLASVHFGERWGRHWLDIARFSESSGGGRSLLFEEAWRYRDYVIAAFNSDKPFDKFVKEQLAGDLLPAANLEQEREHLVATAFLMLGAHNYEEQDKIALGFDVIDEQIDVIGRSMLGMTLACARCHDHKFDPIPTRDYYALAGILRSTSMLDPEPSNVSKWIERPMPDPPAQTKEREAEKTAIAELQAKIQRLTHAIQKANKAKPPEKPIALDELPGIALDDSQAKRVGVWIDSTYLRPYFGAGYIHDGDSKKGQKSLTYIPEFKRAGLYEVRLAYSAGQNRATNVPVEILHLGGQHSGKINQREAPPVDGVFQSLGRFRFDESNQWYIQVSNDNTDGYVVVDALQILPVEDLDKSSEVGDKSDKSQELVRLRRDLESLQARAAKRPKLMAVREAAVIEDCAIRVRGDAHQLGLLVPRGFLQVASNGFMPMLPANQSGRSELSDWIASSENPLGARVIVNRIWKHLFGVGLVRTVDNFGKTGEPPSHPELLDHLAIRFMHNGWSFKKMIRELVLSNTYRQASAFREELTAIDPENRLIGRANRRRLDAESLRDAILAASGSLDRTMGGPTIRKQPSKGTDDDLSADELGYVFADVRRSVYTPVLRNRLHELFETFDFADPNSVVGQRNVSTVSPQALYLLNSTFVMAEAKKFAERLMATTDRNDADRIDEAFQLAVGRAPTVSEMSIALSAVSSEKKGIAMRHDGGSAVMAPTTARSPRTTSVDSNDVSKRIDDWQRLCQAIYGCIDFRYLD